MNHCHDCNSDYSQPGSCNCFALGGKRAVRIQASPPYADTITVSGANCSRCGGLVINGQPHECSGWVYPVWWGPTTDTRYLNT